MIVIVQGSKVLSPATFKILPLKGTGTSATVEAGSCAALQRNLSSLFLFTFQFPPPEAITPAGNVGIDTSNRLGRAPPPFNSFLKP